jgi:hypothetical protein
VAEIIGKIGEHAGARRPTFVGCRPERVLRNALIRQMSAA